MFVMILTVDEVQAVGDKTVLPDAQNELAVLRSSHTRLESKLRLKGLLLERAASDPPVGSVPRSIRSIRLPYRRSRTMARRSGQRARNLGSHRSLNMMIACPRSHMFKSQTPGPSKTSIEAPMMGNRPTLDSCRGKHSPAGLDLRMLSWMTPLVTYNELKTVHNRILNGAPHPIPPLLDSHSAASTPAASGSANLLADAGVMRMASPWLAASPLQPLSSPQPPLLVRKRAHRSQRLSQGVLNWHRDAVAEARKKKAEAWNQRLEALKSSDMEVGDSYGWRNIDCGDM